MTIRLLFSLESLLILLHIGLIFSPLQADAGNQQVRIGALAYRGDAETLKMWSPTADYLNAEIPRYSFSIVPLDFHEIGPAVGRGDVDFVLTNTSLYVELEAQYGITRIATLVNLGKGAGHTVFGGVIFCRSDRADIRGLEDLRGKKFSAVEENSLGGWRVAWRELHGNGLDPYQDFSGLEFAGTHDAVVFAVRDGKADAGTVRTDTLERMADEGKIDLRAFRILNQHRDHGFPFLLSSRLYPEWPFAKVNHTSDELARNVDIALFRMPHDSAAAKAGKIMGWTIPLDYQPVHDLMKELRIGPYRDYGKITLADVIRLYWHWIALSFVALLLMIATTLHVFRLNRHLAKAKQLLEQARNGLEQEVQVRTLDLKTSNDALVHEIAERTKAEHVLRENEIKFRALFDNSVDAIGVSHSGSHVFVNPAYLRLFGYAPHDDLTGKPVLDLIAPGERPAILENLQRRARGERTPTSYETRGLRKNGEEFIMDVHVSTYELSGSMYTLVMLRDITDLKRAEDSLRKNEKKIRDIAASLGEGLYVLDDQGKMTFMNPEAERLLGWTEEDLRGKNIHDLIHSRKPDGSYLSFEECPIHRVIETSGKFISREEVFIRKNGVIFPVSVVSAPLMEDGTIIASITTFRDISERKQLEHDREKLIADLQKALAEIKTLHGVLPICSSCKKIRDDKGAWTQLETYISKHTDALFSHGLCAECAKKLYPDYYKEESSNKP